MIALTLKDNNNIEGGIAKRVKISLRRNKLRDNKKVDASKKVKGDEQKEMVKGDEQKEMVEADDNEDAEMVEVLLSFYLK